MAGISFIQGGLGDGKSAYAMSLIKTALSNNEKVATNYNLNLEKLCRPTNDWSRVIRVPDAPTIKEMRAIGLGSDEPGKSGLLVLDELGVWFNARDFTNKGRPAVLKYIIHLRKKRWKVVFIVQDFSMVDSQLRKMVTFLISCRNSHQGWGPLRCLPRFHYATCRNKERIHVRTDYLLPWELRTLYPVYDTEQLFDVEPVDPEEEVDPLLAAKEQHYRDWNGLYSYLPPALTIDKTKPVEVEPKKKTSWMGAVKLLIFGGASFMLYNRLFASDVVSVEEIAVTEEAQSLETTDIAQVVESPVIDPFFDMYGELVISGSANFGGNWQYVFERLDGATITSRQLSLHGVTVRPRGATEALIIQGDRFLSVHRTY